MRQRWLAPDGAQPRRTSAMLTRGRRLVGTCPRSRLGPSNGWLLQGRAAWLSTRCTRWLSARCRRRFWRTAYLPVGTAAPFGRDGASSSSSFGIAMAMSAEGDGSAPLALVRGQSCRYPLPSDYVCKGQRLRYVPPSVLCPHPTTPHDWSLSEHSCRADADGGKVTRWRSTPMTTWNWAHFG